MDRDRYDRYNDNWQRSNFTDKYSPHFNNNPRWTRSLTDVSSQPGYKTRDHHGQQGHFPRNITNDIDYPPYKRHTTLPQDDYTIKFPAGQSAGSDSTEIIRESDDTHPDRSFVSVLSRFAERTSCVGPPYINSANHFYSKFFWSVVFVAMLVATAVNLYLNAETFLAFPVKTTLSIGYSALTFPMVTVCNTNPLRKSVRHLARQDLQDYITLLNPKRFERPPPGNQGPPGGRRRRFVDDFQRQQNGGNKTFRPPVKGDIGNRLGGEADPLFEAQEDFKYLIGEEFTETRYEMSHQLDDMILSCSFEGRSCEVDNFTKFLTDEYGACYSFNRVNLDEDKVPLYKSFRRGNKYGLQLMMFLQTDEYISGLGLGYGIRLSVSYPKNMAFPDSDGMFVAAGTETDIGVKMINITRLAGLYGDCASPGMFAQEFGFEYSRQACQSVCPHRFILSTCNCYDPSAMRFYPLNTNQSYPPCETDDDFACMEDVVLAVTIDEKQTCFCPSPCVEIAYDIAMSSRVWPEDNYMHALTDKVCRIPGQEAMCDSLLQATPDEQRRNFIKVNVFYRDLNFELLTEEADYPESQFLSDIGGSIGLWVGLSVISLMEVLELVLQIFVWLGRRFKHKRQRRRDSVKHGNRPTETAPSPLKHSATTAPRHHQFARRPEFEERQSNYTFGRGESLW